MKNIKFSRMIKGNESEDLCDLLCEVLTVKTTGFKMDGFVSAEYCDGLIRDVVCVSGRYFTVGTTESGQKKWLSVTLPPGLDPRPKPREWEVWVTPDGMLTNNSDMLTRESVRVREIIEP